MDLQWMENNVFSVLGYAVVLLGIYHIFQTISNYVKLPPGPIGLPIIGYIPFLGAELPEFFMKLSETYGDLFSFQLGQRLTVVLSSWDLIKETFIKRADIYSARPMYGILGIFYDHNSVIAADGEAFNIQKRFLLSSLRDFGFGKLSLEDKIHEEAEAMLEFFRENKNKPIDVASPFNFMSANIICSMALGQRYEYDDPRVQKLMYCFAEILKSMDQVSLVEAYPMLRFLPNKLSGLHLMKEMKKPLQHFIDEIFDEHIETFDANNPRDLIDYYLIKMKESGMDPKEKNSRKLFSRFNVSQNLIMTFFAGTETTATFLTWAVKVFLKHPDVQEKIQKEIDSVLGRAQQPSWADRSKLPYTEATIYEIHRVSSIVPLNAAHANTEEHCLNGYKIPKRSCILTNLWHVHNDPKLWKNPEKFDPTRFLDKDGKAVKPEYLIPFSVGKRACLGEPLSKMEILIFLVSFLQNFSFRCVGEVPDISKVVYGIVRKPQPYQVIVEPR